jgi:hypothetical protein
MEYKKEAGGGVLAGEEDKWVTEPEGTASNSV